MSLLNDMLRDLSHQQSTPETAPAANQGALDFNAQEQRELFYNTSAAKPLPRTLVPSLSVFVVVLAILGLWKMDFFSRSNTNAATTLSVPAQESIQPAVVNPLVVESTKSGQAIESSRQVPAESSSLSEAIDNNSIVPELGERIAALESAITNLSVVVANANSQAANTQEASIQEPARQETNIQDANIQAASNAINPHIDDQAINDNTMEASASISIREPFPQVMPESAAEPQTILLAEAGEPQLSIAPNAKWQDQQQAQQANQLVAQGQTEFAIEKLQHFIATADQPRESVKTLLDIFAMQENTSAIQSLVAQAHYLSIVEQAFYKAKIATIQQQDEQAIQLLETHLGEAERDENYRALLAGLYQRTGMHLEAANHYRRLLGVFGDKPAYWLGFALAQDALNQPQVAVQAYQRVNQYVDLQPQVRTYIQQRIADLHN